VTLLAIALALGAVQGLTEFLPVSSSGHLILTRWFLGWDKLSALQDPSHSLLLDLALHLGTAAAVTWYFRRDLWRVFSSVFSTKKERRGDRRLAAAIVVGCIPAAVVGKLWEHPIEDRFRENIWLIAVLLAAFGVLLWAVDRWASNKRDVESARISDGWWVGLAQTLALAPGVSRSGVTMTAAMALGMKREAAARFSFLLMSPIVIGAAVMKLAEARHLPVSELRELLPALSAGAVSSAVVGLASIAFLLKYLRSSAVTPFAVYRILLALVVLAHFAAIRG
jgi:undecaprenyl-diphosphatase